MERLRTALEQSGIQTETDCPLSRHSTFRIGGNADLAIFPKNAQELIEAIRLCRKAETRTVVIGNGSNVLFRTRAFGERSFLRTVCGIFPMNRTDFARRAERHLPRLRTRRDGGN